MKHRQQLALCRAIAMRFDDAPNGIRRAHVCFIQVGHALQLQVTHTPTPNLLSKPPRDETRVDAIADSTVARTSVPSRDDVHFHPAKPASPAPSPEAFGEDDVASTSDGRTRRTSSPPLAL